MDGIANRQKDVVHSKVGVMAEKALELVPKGHDMVYTHLRYAFAPPPPKSFKSV